MVADRPKTDPAEADAMETAKRIMKRLAETPYEPHKPLGKRLGKSAAPTAKIPASLIGVIGIKPA